MRPIESKTRTGSAGKVKNPRKVRRAVPLGSHRGHPGRPYKRRVGNAQNVVPLPYSTKIKRPRVPIVEQEPVRKVTHNKADTAEPRKWNETRKPKNESYPLYRQGKYMGECQVLEVKVSRISKSPMVRYRVALDGKAVGWAAKVGSHMRYLRRI